MSRNYRCKKCKRYVREEEQTSDMREKKLCQMCILTSNPKKSMFQMSRGY